MIEIGKKILGMILVMWLASVLTFAMLQLSPGDPAIMKLTAAGTLPNEEVLSRTREDMGLNDPLYVQYARWITGVLKGDLGNSYKDDQPVADLIIKRLSTTLQLAATAFGLMVLFSIILGIASAVTKSRWPDVLIRVVSMIEISIPSFWLGLIFIYLFIVKTNLFKLTDTSSFKSVILPALTLAIPMIGRYTRLIRSAVLEEIKKDYVTGAIAKGIKPLKLWFAYILPNSMKKLITLFGMSAATLLGGTVIIENTFARPGLGTLAIDAITYRDYPVLQAYVLFMALIYVGFNLCADLLTQALDPRLRSGGRAYES